MYINIYGEKLFLDWKYKFNMADVPHGNIFMIPVSKRNVMTQKSHVERTTNKCFVNLHSAISTKIEVND